MFSIPQFENLLLKDFKFFFKVLVFYCQILNLLLGIEWLIADWFAAFNYFSSLDCLKIEKVCMLSVGFASLQVLAMQL